MLDKDLYDSWKSRMELYMQNREHGRMHLESVENGPLIWPTVEENKVTKTKKYAELSAAEKIQADCDMKATNMILQGLPADVYSLEKECKLYDAFDKFTHIKGESLHEYYLRFTQMINDINIYNMKMEQFQVNTKFLNSLPPKWSKFVTDVKLVKDLPFTNFDQLHAYLEQHELHANEVRLMRERNQDPLAFVANQQMTPPHFNTYQSLYNNPQLQQQFSKSYCSFFKVSGNGYSQKDKNNAKTMLLVKLGHLTTSGQARVVKCYNCHGEGHMARQCTQLKRPRNAAWYKEKAIILTDQAQSIIPHNAAFQTEDLDTYDSDYVISEVPHSETYLNDMDNQSVHALQDFEQSPVMDFPDKEMSSDSNIISYSQYLQETQQATVQDTNLQVQQDSMILYVIEQMSEKMINRVNNWEKANKEQNNKSITVELERYKERVKNFCSLSS
ncbi:retrovirus-related pol polyprotein from transposon TNT 1-94 [Tanacetum coccineum]